MPKRKERGFCLGLLLFAILVRSIAAVPTQPEPVQEEPMQEEPMQEKPKPPVSETAPKPITGVALMQLVEPVSVAQQTKNFMVSRWQQRQPSVRLAPFTPEEAERIAVGGACSYPVDRQQLLLQPSALDFSAEGPKVLIVHTHSCEAYTQTAGWEYTAVEPLRSLQPEASVIRVGQCMAELLQQAGIETIHDTALNDYPDYEGAYERMRRTIEGYLQQYPSIQLVLDIHRDAAEDAAGNQVAFVTEREGADFAGVMLVVGTDEGGLYHPGWRENLANALKLQAVVERSCPGLCRSIDLRTERFNAHETPGSLLIEVGAAGNTMEQALRSAAVLAEALRDLIKADYGR